MKSEILFTWGPNETEERYYYLVEDYNSRIGKWTPYSTVPRLRQAKYWAKHVTKQGRYARVSRVTRGES